MPVKRKSSSNKTRKSSKRKIMSALSTISKLAKEDNMKGHKVKFEKHLSTYLNPESTPADKDKAMRFLAGF